MLAVAGEGVATCSPARCSASARVALTQLLVAAVASLATIVAFDQIQVPSAVPSVVGWVILWFVLGYAFYSVLYAALGALVSRAEDVEGAQAPLGFFLMGCL